jgi:spore coat-associated protein N
MSIKKKMGTGILAGALGLSLVGGGTWAAFNDVETTSNTFAAGTLDLVVGETSTMNFNISNLKPGDYFTKKLVLTNNGSLNINDILVHAKKVTTTTFQDKNILNLPDGLGVNSEEEFLSQFKIEISKENATTNLYEGSLSALANGIGVGELTGTEETTTPNVVGLAIGATNTYDVKVTFVEDPTKIPNSRLFVQNKYQGESTDLQFVFEATQMPGELRDNN